MTLLIRIDPELHMNRWYRVTVQPTLFHPVAVVQMWGSRESDYQQVRYIPTATHADAERLAARIIALKLRRGYRPSSHEP